MFGRRCAAMRCRGVAGAIADKWTMTIHITRQRVRPATFVHLQRPAAHVIGPLVVADLLNMYQNGRRSSDVCCSK
jgi:hypothetical protein